MGREKNDKLLPSSLSRPNTFLRVGGSKEQLLDNQAQEEQRREMLETVKQLTGAALESDRNSTEAERHKGKETGEPAPGLGWAGGQPPGEGGSPRSHPPEFVLPGSGLCLLGSRF